MIKLNRITDYAIVVMAAMGRDLAGMHTAQALARDTAVPLPTVSKVLKQLARDGLIVSHRGAAGGYTLGRPPGAITVAEIISAMEGPIALAACVDGAGGHCEVESFCAMRGNWNKVNHAIRRALEEVTLADMAAPPPLPVFTGGADARKQRVGALS